MKKLIMASITAAVVIIVLAGTLIPVLDDATATEDVMTNGGLYRMDKVAEDTDITIEWDYTNPNVLTVDGEDVALPTEMTSTPYVIACSGNWLLQYTYSSSFGYYVGFFQNANTAAWYGTESGSVSLSVTIASSVITVVSGTDSHTAAEESTGSIYVVSATGDYVMKNAADSAYVLNDSEIYAYGRLTTAGSNYLALLTGSIEDGITGAYYPASVTSGWTVSDVSASKTADSDHVDLYKLDTLGYTATISSTDYNVSIGQFIVPYQVTAEKAVHFTNGENAILAAIPALVIVALLLGIVAVVLRGRN